MAATQRSLQVVVVVVFQILCLWQLWIFTRVVIYETRKKLNDLIVQTLTNLHQSTALASVHYRQRNRKARIAWMLPNRCTVWWDVTVQQHFTQKDWLENFRMSRESFEVLCEMLKDYLSPAPNCIRQPVPLRKRVAIALYKLASCCEYRVVANQFGVHKATVHVYFYQFCKSVVKLKERFIYLPSGDEAKEIASRIFCKHHFPQVMGAIDGTHIPILPPENGKRDFINRKYWASYVLQAVVDDHFLFRDISCKVPGSAHDASVLRHSSLYKNAAGLPKSPINIDGVPVPLMILGDPAYPLLEWLLKGFTGYNLLPEEESFNVYLSSARIMVEIAFGRLKSRWRMLCKRSDIFYAFVPTVVATACILHNFCEVRSENCLFNWGEFVNRSNINYPQPESYVNQRPDRSITDVRRTLVNYLAKTVNLRQSF